MKEKFIIPLSILLFVFSSSFPLQCYCKGKLDENNVEKDNIEELIAQAESHIKQGFQNNEQLRFWKVRGGENFALARKYFSQAETLLNEDRAKLLLKWGWFKYRTNKDKSEAIRMLEEGLSLSPNNPEGYYKIGYVKLKSYYRSFEPKDPRVVEVLPDGSEILEEVEYYYSIDRDNSELEAAQSYFEKAIKLDNAFATAYNQLAKVHIFKNELFEASDDYSKLLKYKDHIDLELLFFDKEGKEKLTKTAKSFLEYHPLQENN